MHGWGKAGLLERLSLGAITRLRRLRRAIRGDSRSINISYYHLNTTVSPVDGASLYRADIAIYTLSWQSIKKRSAVLGVQDGPRVPALRGARPSPRRELHLHPIHVRSWSNPQTMMTA
jgi:hypothetical protein